MYRARIDSPFGPMLLCGDEKGLSGLYFVDQRDCPTGPGRRDLGSEVPAPKPGQFSDAALRALRPLRRMGEGRAQMTLFAGDAASSGSPSNGETTVISKGAGTNVGGSIDQSGPQDRGPEWLQQSTPDHVRSLFMHTQAQLGEYFAGRRMSFELPLNLSGTEFQVRIWKALCQVPYGELASYSELATMAGLGSGHGRAVGTAVGRNPVSIIVPCHRIIGSNQTLTGYTGGLSRKVALLELEGFAFV